MPLPRGKVGETGIRSRRSISTLTMSGLSNGDQFSSSVSVETKGRVMQKLGFIGLGIMGSPMGKNLLRAGYSIIAYDVDPEMARRMEQEGATLAKSPREVA
ncbi:NAD(P)-binding domain-containing protein, partial [Pseudorhodoplanes sp.]|uniref:NAD(P)-binding domain-containing protein n=1 Tax=Pseudorhodoplanes sp. TaxID=1934341 RepID=UPI003D1236E3